MALKILFAACTFLHCATIFTTEYNAKKSQKLLKLCDSKTEPSLEKIRKLLMTGANPHAKTFLFQSTPLQITVKKNRIAIVELLLQYGADFNAKDYSANDITNINNQPELANLLKAYGILDPRLSYWYPNALSAIIEKNPHSLTSRKDKLFVAKFWIAQAMFSYISNYLHYAQFTEDELYTLFNHLCYVSIRLSPQSIAKIFNHLDYLQPLDMAKVNRFIVKLPLKKQKMLLYQALPKTALATMRTTPFTDVVFIMNNN